MGGVNFAPSFFDQLSDRLAIATFDTNAEFRMGIADIRTAFLDVAGNGWRITDCELHTVPDGKNSQQLIINGMDANGSPFQLDSGPFDPMVSPVEKAREMAGGTLNSPSHPMQPAVVPVPQIKQETKKLPLIEIKGLGATVATAKKGIADLRAAAGSFQTESAALASELSDLTEQIKQHRADLRFEAETLSNGGGNSDAASNSSGS